MCKLLKPLLQIRGTVDAIVHNAGSLVNKPFADLTQRPCYVYKKRI
jgi:hypothetical protein